MAKVSMVQKELKRKKISDNSRAKRSALRKERNNKNIGITARMILQEKLDRMPRNTSSVRCRNRCFMTGRPRGYYRQFGLSRIMLRHLSSFGKLPGVTKSSW